MEIIYTSDGNSYQIMQYNETGVFQTLDIPYAAYYNHSKGKLELLELLFYFSQQRVAEGVKL